MPSARYVYALADWTVEYRPGKGWYFSRTAQRHVQTDWRGPYASEASVTLVVARELRKEIVRRHARMMAREAAA